jgi:hypothetical protein
MTPIFKSVEAATQIPIFLFFKAHFSTVSVELTIIQAIEGSSVRTLSH